MDNSLDRNQLWTPPLARAPQQYHHLQSQPEFLLPGKPPLYVFESSHPTSLTLLIHSGQHGGPSNTVTRRGQPGGPPSSQIQLEEHQPSYPRTHLPFPQHQRYLSDGQVHPHAHVQRRPYPIPQSASDSRDDTPGPSQTSAEDDADDYPNGTAADADSNVSMDEEPLYVNAKQYNRILKRRVARARLEELHRLSRQRKVRPAHISVPYCRIDFAPLPALSA